jgi:hypothetical protein
MNVSESKYVRPVISSGENERLKPEWLRLPEAMRIFGLGRSTLYELIAGGKIQSTPLRKPGAKRGIRLIRYDSLALYLEGKLVENRPNGALVHCPGVTGLPIADNPCHGEPTKK